MQKKNCVLCISIGIIVCILLSACSKQPDFDAKSYVQSSLDAYYHGEYKDYANLLEISEKDAKKEIEEDFNESIQQQFDDSDNITDKGIADYAEKLAEVKKLAKYKVQDVKEEDGVYTVSVQVEPSNVFQTLQQSSTEVSNEKIKQGLDGNDPEVFAAVLTESVQKSLEKNSYGKTVTVKVSVEKDNSGKYGLSDTEMSKLELLKITGIHGASGSGKSTLLKLLMRFWDVQDGSVSVDGTDVRKIPTKHLRDMESYVTQETHLFHDSIANNIAIAKPGASREEIMEAAKKASIHDFIMTLPKGYDTEVGELGDTLSGGEKQRIGIARAFLHECPLILLDEPTSNLDSLNEGIILKSLKESAKKKTVVLVSHRVSTMNVADVVYEMENGRIS